MSDILPRQYQANISARMCSKPRSQGLPDFVEESTFANKRTFFPRWTVCQDETAFTLLELVVVMVLISIAMSFAVPTLRNSLYSDELKASSRKLISLISETSQASYLSSVPYTMEYDKENHQFSIRADAVPIQGQAQTPSVLKLPETVTIKDITSFYGGVNAEGAMSVFFSKNGYVDMTLIHLEDEDQEVTLFLPPFLGSIKIFEGYVDIEDERLF